MNEINYLFIMSAMFFVAASPGPATLSIASTSMNQGRLSGSIFALGILMGSISWSIFAAFGFNTLIGNNIYVLEIIRYMGASYLMYLAYKASKSALSNNTFKIEEKNNLNLFSTFLKGLLIHLTNPKAILFFISIYAIAIPSNTSKEALLEVILLLAIEAFIIFQVYAYIFSIKKVRDFYVKGKSWFEGIFAAFFAFASIKIFFSKLT